MRIGVFALVAAALCAPTGAFGSACGTLLHLTVDPAAKASAVAAVELRRLQAAGAVAPSAEVDGAGVRAVLPTGLEETLLTRPAKIEFRLIAADASDAGALVLPRRDGGPAESVSPQIILDETHMREFRVQPAPGGAALAFHFDPHAIKNLMAATTEAVGGKLAILIDDQIVADPTIRAPIASTVGEIPGGALNSAAELAVLVGAGRLPAKVAVAGREPAPCRTP